MVLPDLAMHAGLAAATSLASAIRPLVKRWLQEAAAAQKAEPPRVTSEDATDPPAAERVLILPGPDVQAQTIHGPPLADVPPETQAKRIEEGTLSLIRNTSSVLERTDSEILRQARSASRMVTGVLAVSAAAFAAGVVAVFVSEPIAGAVVAIGSLIGGGTGARHFVKREEDAYGRLERVRAAAREASRHEAALAALHALPDSPEKHRAIIEYAKRLQQPG